MLDNIAIIKKHLGYIEHEVNKDVDRMNHGEIVHSAGIIEDSLKIVTLMSSLYSKGEGKQ